MPSRKALVISGPVPLNKPANFKPLDLPSLDFSLTAGTNIPSPPATPTLQEESDEIPDGHRLVRSPTPGGGPLSSHPTTPVVIGMPGAFPTTPPATDLKANRVLGRNPNDGDKQAHLPFPREASAAALPSAPPAMAGSTAPSRRSSIIGIGGKGGSMRRLFSLRSLYSNSNASSTDCFSGGANSSSHNLQHLSYGGHDAPQPSRLARMSSSDSFAQPYRPASSMANGRPQSRMTDVSVGGDGKSPSLRSKSRRSSTFFGSGSIGSARRKSGLFLFGGARVDANGTIPEDGTEAEKENREPPPTIQEVHVDTSIGGEELFRNIQ